MQFPLKRRQILQSIGGLIAVVSFHPQKSHSKQQERSFYVATNGNDEHPGTLEQPWASLQKAAQSLIAGDTVYIRGGLYRLDQAIKPKHSGTASAWITYQNYDGEIPILDADAIPVGPWGTLKAEDDDSDDDPSRNRIYQKRPYPPERGSLQIHGKQYLRIQGLTIRNSHSAGLEVRNSHHIDLFNNTTVNTFSCGILVDAGIPVSPTERSHHIRVIGNNITGANNAELQIIHPNFTNHQHAPHEALSIGAVDYFEVAYNHVSFCFKELLDCKDSCRHGIVHHNYLHNAKSIGLYVDAWFSDLDDIILYQNIIHNCKIGMAISVEGSTSLSNLMIRNNQIFDNLGSGIIFGVWGNDGWRENIAIYNNTIYRNGYGDGDEEGNNTEDPYWVTGGIYLHSQQIKNLIIQNNIFNANQHFQVGHSHKYSKEKLEFQNLNINHNLFFEPVEYPQGTVLERWAKDVAISIYGELAIYGNPKFIGRDVSDLRLHPDSPALGQGKVDLPLSHVDLGALPKGEPANFWWAYNFPQQTDPNGVSEVDWKA